MEFRFMLDLSKHLKNGLTITSFIEEHEAIRGPLTPTGLFSIWEDICCAPDTMLNMQKHTIKIEFLIYVLRIHGFGEFGDISKRLEESEVQMDHKCSTCEHVSYKVDRASYAVHACKITGEYIMSPVLECSDWNPKKKKDKEEKC